jgi:hypothetical protein
MEVMQDKVSSSTSYARGVSPRHAHATHGGVTAAGSRSLQRSRPRAAEPLSNPCVDFAAIRTKPRAKLHGTGNESEAKPGQNDTSAAPNLFMTRCSVGRRMTRPFALSLLLFTASANDIQADGVHGACEAALHEQRSIYESKLASLRQQLESANCEDCEARTHLVSLRATSSRVVNQDADAATGPPSKQSVPDGADGLGLGLRLLGLSSSPQVADTTHSLVRNRSSSLDRASNLRPQNAHGAVGRSLLQAQLEDRACSKAEAHAVLSAALDPIPIVMGIMGTNPSCAVCIIGCVEKKPFDAVVCVHSCLDQRENVCNKSTGLERLTPLISNASLGDRDSLVRLMLVAESDCTPRSSSPRPF